MNKKHSVFLFVTILIFCFSFDEKYTINLRNPSILILNTEKNDTNGEINQDEIFYFESNLGNPVINWSYDTGSPIYRSTPCVADVDVDGELDINCCYSCSNIVV